MKTSHALILLTSLLLRGAKGFSNFATLQRVTHTGGPVRKHSSANLSRLFQQPDNPKQELLNNRHSASDWLYNVRSLPQSEVLREIRNPVLSVFAWACIVSFVQRAMLYSKANLVRTLAAKMCIPGAAHSFLMSSLGLLLVFRTNSAYQRFNVRSSVALGFATTKDVSRFSLMNLCQYAGGKKNLGTCSECVSKHDSFDSIVLERSGHRSYATNVQTHCRVSVFAPPSHSAWLSLCGRSLQNRSQASINVARTLTHGR